MNKKTGRIAILVVIAAVVVFVLFDFFKDSSKEEKSKEAASQQEQVIPEDTPEETDEEFETDESDKPEEDMDFDSSDELEEDFDSEENEDKSPLVSYGASKGDTAYDYDMTDIHTGEVVKLSDYRGQKVFLNFWASWCPPCRVEAPHLQEFSENQDDVAVIGVNVKVSESNLDNVQGFIDEFDLTFKNLFGPEEMFGPFAVESLPTSFFINSNGVIEED